MMTIVVEINAKHLLIEGALPLDRDDGEAKIESAKKCGAISARMNA